MRFIFVLQVGSFFAPIQRLIGCCVTVNYAVSRSVVCDCGIVVFPDHTHLLFNNSEMSQDKLSVTKLNLLKLIQDFWMFMKQTQWHVIALLNRKFHTVKNWYQFFTAREKLVPIRHIFHTNISHFVKFAHVLKLYVAYMRNLNIDKKHPKSAAFCNRIQFFTFYNVVQTD